MITETSYRPGIGDYVRLIMEPAHALCQVTGTGTTSVEIRAAGSDFRWRIETALITPAGVTA